MSTQPRIEARVSAQERRQINIEARIEELSEDVATSLKHLSEDMTASFSQVNEYLVKIDETTEERLNKIKTTMATKEDLVEMEKRILNAFKQVLTMINPQQPPK